MGVSAENLTAEVLSCIANTATLFVDHTLEKHPIIASLCAVEDITIITNSFVLADIWMKQSSARLLMLGGQVSGNSLAAAKVISSAFFQHINMDSALILANEWDQNGFACHSAWEYAFYEALMKAVARRIILTPNSGQCDVPLPYRVPFCATDVLINTMPG